MYFSNLENYFSKKNIYFVHKNKISSTMDFARKFFILKNKILIVLSDIQTSGRGRLNNSWKSKYGNIFLTIKMFPEKKVKNFFELSILSCLAIKKTIKNFNIDDVFFKWPNDIYINNSKVGGILIEIDTDGKNTFCLIGIGINLVSSPNIKNYKTSFLQKYNKSIKKKEFVKLLVENIISFYDKWNSNKNLKLIDQYKKSLMYIGKNIIININNNNSIKGKFIDLTKEGYLIIKKNNKNKIILSGTMGLY